MPDSGTWPSPGPLETAPFPDQLKARVVTPGEQPRIHGYDVQSDLARNYSPSEVAFLAVTGELPAPEVAAALDVILVFASPVSVAHAPTHAAVLAQLCGAPATSVISVAAIGLAEQVRHLIDEHEQLMEWLDAPTGPLPAQFRSESPEEVRAVGELHLGLRAARLEVPVLSRHLTTNAAVLAALHACGLARRQHVELFLVWTRLPIVVAEALAEHEGNFKNYPANLPRFVYQEPTP